MFSCLRLLWNSDVLFFLPRQKNVFPKRSGPTEQVPPRVRPGLESGALHRRCQSVPRHMGQFPLCCESQIHRCYCWSRWRRGLPGRAAQQGLTLLHIAPHHTQHTTAVDQYRNVPLSPRVLMILWDLMESATECSSPLTIGNLYSTFTC